MQRQRIFLYFCCMKCSLLHRFTAAIYLLMGVVAAGFLTTACREMVPQSEVERVDALNAEAYAWHYRNPSRSSQRAHEALQAAELYGTGRAEAWNNLGMAAFMRMEYAEAERCFEQAQRATSNQTELLVADVGRMKLCQRMARNKAFYDYRNRALQRLKRIEEEEQTPMTSHARSRLRFARSECYLTSATYYYYLQQQEDAREAMELLRRDPQLPADTGQWLYAAYLEGAAALMKPQEEHDRRLHCFDLLYATFREAAANQLIYIEGNALQGMANLMTSPRAYAFFDDHRSHELMQCHLLLGLDSVGVDSLFPLRLGQEALKRFTQYGDPYQVANGYVTISRYLNDHGRYTEALDSLQRAQEWVSDEAIPECQLRIDEQLSVSYAGLGNKGESDRYRNRYLDIMERTRQDRELENRLETLERESAQLNLSLLLLVAVLLLSVLLLMFLGRYRRKRQLRMLLRLRRLIALCRTISGAIPPTAATSQEMEEALLQAMERPLRPLFGEKRAVIEGKQLRFDAPLTTEEEAMLKLINPYVEWALENGAATLMLEEQRIMLEEQRAMHELHIAAGKRQNVAKRACLSVVNGIFPFIDRILHEVERLKCELPVDGIYSAMAATQQRQRLHYIHELAGTINEYNEMLAYWIQMRQGRLSLHIETFALSELLELLAKGSRAFVQKRQQLLLCPTPLRVKADKALTLFMLNTLMENARKYTPEGGEIRVEAYEVPGEGCVEIAVTDNGPGLSPADVQLINERKVYDPALIGLEGHPEEVKRIRQAKGSGFGLMNCKGIIESYRKSAALFSCCSFRVESQQGKGCCFRFRLPLGQGVADGLKGMLTTGALLIGMSCSLWATSPATEELMKGDNPTYAEALLDTASTYADRAYYSNVEGAYAATILYADSAIAYLNRHLELSRPLLPEALRQLPLMQLTGEEEAAELTWWHTPYDSDYHIILDVRNEAAVAFLALKEWEAYRYNNFAYTSLYKLLGEDRSLEAYCHTLQRHTDHKSVALVCSILLLFLLLGGYLLMAFRRRMMTQWNMEQVLDITHRLYASTTPLPDEEHLQELPQRMMGAVYEAIRAILPLRGMALAYYNEHREGLEVTCQGEAEEQSVIAWMERCYKEERRMEEGPQLLFPLLLKQGEASRCIGVLYLLTERESDRPTHLLLLQLITDYWSVVLYHALMKISGKYRDIESAHDETQRASWEESKLHVQNLVLDNCLSTIKHETIYYPNKIKLLASQLEQMADRGIMTTAAQVEEMGELMAYYKGIFSLLSSCADRQVERVMFRRTAVGVKELADYATQCYQRTIRGYSTPPRPFIVVWEEGESAVARDEAVWGDEELLHYLMECLIRSQLALPSEGSEAMSLHIGSTANGFVRFTLCDPLQRYTEEELNGWFHPQMKQIKRYAHGKCEGTDYLVAKQIIRLHDELAGRRGCRINAERLEPQGMAIYFTLNRVPNGVGAENVPPLQ